MGRAYSCLQDIVEMDVARHVARYVNIYAEQTITHLIFGNLVFPPLLQSSIMVILPFFYFVILRSLFSNEAAICPYFVTPFGLGGLNEKNK